MLHGLITCFTTSRGHTSQEITKWPRTLAESRAVSVRCEGKAVERAVYISAVRQVKHTHIFGLYTPIGTRLRDTKSTCYPVTGGYFSRVGKENAKHDVVDEAGLSTF